jgi:hypothetical protein
MAYDDDTVDLAPDDRRRRAIVTVLVVVLLLFFAFWYALSYIRADDERRSLPPVDRSTTCPVEPADITVNVLNGTKREGLAASVSGTLRKRGFVIGEVGNFSKSNVAGVGQVRFGAEAGHQVKVVTRHLGDVEQVQVKRKGTKIDVILGKDFTQLVPLSQAKGC